MGKNKPFIVDDEDVVKIEIEYTDKENTFSADNGTADDYINALSNGILQVIDEVGADPVETFVHMAKNVMLTNGKVPSKEFARVALRETVEEQMG